MQNTNVLFNFNPETSPLFNFFSKLLPKDVNPEIEQMGISIITDLGEQLQKTYSPLLDCTMSSEQIQEKSILDSFEIGGMVEEIPDLRKALGKNSDEEAVLSILGNFCGGGLVTGDALKLDGMKSPTPNFQIWNWLFRHIRASMDEGNAIESSVVDSLIADTDSLIEFSHNLDALLKNRNKERLTADATKYANRVVALRQNESYVFYGGWQNRGGGSGHAYAYEFICTDENRGLYDFNVYNSTGFQLAQSYASAGIAKQTPVVHYSHIPQEHLFFSGDGVVRPEFIQHLMELNVLATWETNRVVDEEDVLELLDHLMDYYVEAKKEDQGLIKGQRGGTCVPSSTKEWVRHRCQNEGRFKQLDFHVDIRLMIAGFRSLERVIEEDSKLGAEARYVLEQIGRNQLRALVKNVEGAHGFGALMDEDLALTFEATLYDILQRVDIQKKIIEESRRYEVEKSGVHTVENSGQRRQRASIPQKLAVRAQRNFNNGASRASVSVSNFEISIEEEEPQAAFALFMDKVEELRKLSSVVGKDVEVFNRDIHTLLDQLPFPSKKNSYSFDKDFSLPFVDGLALEEKEMLLESIQELVSLYVANCDKDFPSRYYATTLTLYSYTHYLACRIEKEQFEGGESRKASISSYSIPSLGKTREIESLVYYDRQEYERVQGAMKYLDYFSPSSYKPLFGTEQSVTVQKHVVAENTQGMDRGELWKGLMARDSELKQHLEELGNQRWPDLTEEEIKEDYKARYSVYKKALEVYNEKQKEKKGSYYRGRPKLPERKVNLPSDTKCTMILEEAFALDHNVLVEHGYGYIVHFRRLSYLLNQSSPNSKIVRLPSSIKAQRESDFSINGKVNKNITSSSFTMPHNRIKKNITIKSQHRIINSDHEQFFSKNVVKREISYDRSSKEGDTLKDVRHGYSILKKFERLSSEWKLTPYQMMMECEESLDYFRDPSFQSLFLRLFFRSPIDVGEKLGAGDLIVKDRALRDLCLKFTNRGLNYFRQLSRREGLEGARFFLEFSFYISKYLKDAGLEQEARDFESVAFIDGWLHKEKPSLEESAVLHRYRFLHTSLNFIKDQDLCDIEEFNKKLASLYWSWISSHIYPDSETWRSPMVEHFTEQFAIELQKEYSVRFDEDETLRAEVFTKVLKGLGVPNIGENLVVGKEPATELMCGTVLEATVSGEHWEIELLKGGIYSRNRGKIQSRLGASPWESNIGFQRLFHGKKGFSYMSAGRGCYLFEHPEFGAFEVHNQSLGHAIRRQFPCIEGVTFQYQEEEDLGKARGVGIPSILQKDHIFWTPVGGVPEGSQITGYFTDLKEHKIRYATTVQGEILEVDEFGVPKEQGLTFDYMEKSEGKVLRFEEQENILICQKEGLPHSIVFPRYTSDVGNPLKFLYQNDEIVWSENHNYVLPKNVPSGYLGDFSEYLFLRSLDDRRSNKLLVPFQPILRGNGIRKNNTQPLLPQDSIKEQWGCFEYFTFDVANGSLKGTTRESSLYLAYIYLSQRKYKEASKLLRAIKPTESLSPTSMKILEMIMEFSTGEGNAEGKMVRLYALFTYLCEKDRLAREKIDAYFDQESQIPLSLLVEYLELLQTLNDVSTACRFTVEEEKKVLDFLIPFTEQKVRTDSDQKESFKGVLVRLRQRLSYLESGKETAQEYRLIKGADREFPRSEGRRLRGEFPMMHDFRNFLCVDLSEPQRDAYEEEENYNAALQNYNNSLFGQVIWLSSEAEIDPSSLMVSQSGMVNLSKNGALFRYVYEVAKEGTVSERRALAYRFKQWRIHSIRQNRLLDFLIILLVRPTSFPDLIDLKSATDKEKYLFLKEIESGIPRFSLQHLENFLSGEKTYQRSSPRGNYISSPESIFDVAEEGITQFGEEKVSLEIEVEEPVERWNTLEMWKENYLQEIEAPTAVDDMELSLAFDPSFIFPEEKTFEPSFKKDLKALKKDCSKGKEQLESETLWNLLPEKGEAFLDEVNNTLKEVKNSLQEEEADVLEVLNRWKANVASSGARVGGGAARLATFDDCILAVLSMDEREFKQWNPYLTSAEIQTLAADILRVEDLKSYKKQLEVAKEKCEEILSINDLEDPVRSYRCYELGQLLNARYHRFERFSLDVQVVLRVFAGETGMIPYEKQIDLIEDMLELDQTDHVKFKDKVRQLIMGGGKTTLIAPIILYQAARRQGRLSLFILPDSLVETVKVNCSDALLKAFKKDLLSIDARREDLTIHKLIEIEKKLERADKKSEPFIVKVSTIQIIELELLTLSRQVKNEWYKTQTIDREKVVRVGKLSKIWKRIQETGDILGDEGDLLLDCRKDTNFPDGDEVSIPNEENALLEHIYKTLMSEKIQILELFADGNGTPLTIADIVGLGRNEQSLMDTKVYKKTIVPLVARTIVEEFAPIKNAIKGFNESFIRYASGTIPALLQQYADNEGLILTEETLNEKCPGWTETYSSIEEVYEDIAFLKYLSSIFNSGFKGHKEQANLIALALHLLCDVTPATLGKSGRRDYGPRQKGDSKTIVSYENDEELLEEERHVTAIVPYLAVNVPATTEFGYYLEEACYYYQWFAAETLEKEEILQIAKDYEQSARYYVEKNEEKYEETVEFLLFEQIFGVSLHDIYAPENLAFAQKCISENPIQRLELAFDTIGHQVTRRSERLSSNGVNLTSQCSSRRKMTGTPWNVKGFPKALLDGFKADEGTEGKILHTLAKKVQEEHIHEVNFDTVKKFIQSIIRNHPTPEKVRGIIEAGGLFKVFENNKEVAEELMKGIEEMQNEGEISRDIEGVLFFQEDTLYLAKRGASKPIYIGGTSREFLAAKGLDPKKYFVYYDERHTTGVDILQTPDAINLFTFDEKMTRRTIGQGAMRLRQLLFSQSIELVVTPKIRKMLINGGRTFEDFVISAEKMQSIKKTKDMVRHFSQQIDNIFRFPAVEKIVDASLQFGENGMDEEEGEAYANLVSLYERFFVTNTLGDHYLLHGRLKDDQDTQAILLDELEQRWKLFCGFVDDETLLQKVALDVEEMRQHIENTKALPSKWKSGKSSLGVEQEVETEVAVEVEAEMEIDVTIEEEILLELERYMRGKRFNVKPDKNYSYSDFIEFLTRLKAPDLNLDKQEITSLQEQFQKHHYSTTQKRYFYENCFGEEIYGTSSYFTPYSVELPIFHPAHKPAKQILAVQVGDQMRWILLSEYQANVFREHFISASKRGRKQLQGVWLVQPNGSCLIEGQIPFPVDDEHVQQGLMEINAFLGNVKYINKHATEFEEWLLSGDTEEQELKVRFLKLRVARDKEGNRILRCNPQIHSIDQTLSHNSMIAKSLRARVEKEAGNLGNLHMEPVEVKAISLKNVKNLNVSLVPHLGLDWEQRESDAVTQEAFGHLEDTLNSEQFPVDSEERELELQRLADEKNQKVFRRLARFQVQALHCTQMRWLPVSKVGGIRSPEQMYQIEDDHPVYYLSEEQVLGLQEHQAHLIPFVNPEFYPLLQEPWMVEAIPVEHVDKISEDLWIHLSKEQVSALPSGSLFEKLKHPRQFGWINGNLLREIPRNKRSNVREEQILEINDRDLIFELEELAAESEGITVPPGRWTQWVDARKVKHINFDVQLQYLSKAAQIHSISDKYVEKLDPFHQVPLVAKKQVPLLRGPLQIQRTPEKYIYLLEPEQIPDIAEEQAKHLREKKQVRALKGNKQLIGSLTAKNDVDEGTVNQMEWISDQQLGYVKTHQVKGLSNRQLLELAARRANKWEKLRKGLSKQQIESFDSIELIALLSAEQMRQYLSEEQVSLLTLREHIQACPDRYVSALDGDQLALIVPDQIAHLNHAKLLFVRETFHDEYSWPELRDRITQRQIHSFDSKPLVALLSPEQKQQLLPEQVLFLENEELLAFSDRRDYLDHMSVQQIESFDSQDLIDLLSPQQINNHLQQGQVPFLRTEEQVQACPNHCLGALSIDEQLSLTSLQQLKNLPRQEQVRAIPFGKVQHLTREQLRQRSWGQFFAYTIGVLALGVVSSIVALVAYMTLMPFALRWAKPEWGNVVIEKLNSNPYRLYRYFEVYAARSVA